jgi:hypothetical protein
VSNTGTRLLNYKRRADLREAGPPRWAVVGGGDGVLRDERFHRVGAESALTAAGEQWVVRFAAAFAQPDAQCGHGLGGQWCAAFLTALSRPAARCGCSGCCPGRLQVAQKRGDHTVVELAEVELPRRRAGGLLGEGEPTPGVSIRTDRVGARVLACLWANASNLGRSTAIRQTVFAQVNPCGAELKLTALASGRTPDPR